MARKQLGVNPSDDRDAVSKSYVTADINTLISTDNLILAPDFDTDAYWANAFGTQSTDQAYSGTKSRLITATGSGTGPSGDRLTLTHDASGDPLRLLSSPGRNYQALVKLRKHASNTGTASPALHLTLVWYDNSGTESVIADATIDEVSLSSAAWTDYFIGGDAPANTVSVGLYVAIDSTVPVSNQYYVDQAYLTDATMVASWGMTMSNKTLSEPRMNIVRGSLGNTMLDLWDQTSAVNYLQIANRATGSPPYIEAKGSDTNISLGFTPKGTGTILIWNSAPTITADGPGSNRNLNFETFGTGVVQANGVAVVTTSGAQTLTNKRVNPRVTSISSSATPTINTDSCDVVTITALATNITSMTTNLTGTPVNFQKLLIRIKDDGTARTITWGASFQSGSAVLPPGTNTGKTLLVGLIYDSVDAKWTCEATGSRP